MNTYWHTCWKEYSQQRHQHVKILQMLEGTKGSERTEGGYL